MKGRMYIADPQACIVRVMTHMRCVSQYARYYDSTVLCNFGCANLTCHACQTGTGSGNANGAAGGGWWTYRRVTMRVTYVGSGVSLVAGHFVEEYVALKATHNSTKTTNVNPSAQSTRRWREHAGEISPMCRSMTS